MPINQDPPPTVDEPPKDDRLQAIGRWLLDLPNEKVKKQARHWWPWAGVAIVLLAIFVLRFTGFGRYASAVGAGLAVASVLLLWERTEKQRRIVLLIVPAVAAVVLGLIYMSLPHGMSITAGPSLTNPNKDQSSQSDPGMFGNAYGNGSGQSDQTGTDQGSGSSTGEDQSSNCGYEACGAPGNVQIEGDPAHNDHACNTVEGCDPQLQGSQPEATTAPGYPTADMPQDERLALWAELNPVEDMEENPTADSSNDEWLKFVNYCLQRVQTSPYHLNHGEYWMSFGAVADPHGALVVKPIPGQTQYQYATYIQNATDWVGDEGDNERSVTADVLDNNGDYHEGVKVSLKLIEIGNTGRYVVLADLV